jgi:hypothetical protein
MLVLRQNAAFVLLLAFSLSVYGTMQQQQQQPPPVYIKPNQTVDLAPAIMGTARQNCENWALAAGLETILQWQDVHLEQSYWVRHLNGGELCVHQLPSMDELAKVVNKEFSLEDGRRVRLELHFVRGAPVDTGALIGGLQQQQLSLFLWHGHPYYMSGVTYDEYTGGSYGHMFLVKEVRLANTYARQPNITFQRDRDNMSEIAGVLSVSVIPL